MRFSTQNDNHITWREVSTHACSAVPTQAETQPEHQGWILKGSGYKVVVKSCSSSINHFLVGSRSFIFCGRSSCYGDYCTVLLGLLAHSHSGGVARLHQLGTFGSQPSARPCPSWVSWFLWYGWAQYPSSACQCTLSEVFPWTSSHALVPTRSSHWPWALGVLHSDQPIFFVSAWWCLRVRSVFLIFK